MAGLVPQEDLPQGLLGRLVPESDLPTSFGIEPKKKPEDQGIIESGIAALKRGFEQFGDIGTGYGVATSQLVGDRETVARKMAEAKAEAQRQSQQTGGIAVADLERIYKEKGLVNAAGEVPQFLIEQTLQALPTMATPLAAGFGVTALTAPVLGPLAPIAGGLAGIGTYGLQQFGSLMRTQALAKERPEELEVGKAAIGAALQAPLGYFADRFTAGIGGLGQKGVLEVGKELAARKAIGEIGTLGVAKGVGAQAAKGSALGFVAEAPTEALEQVIERWQAGLPLGDEEAYREYKEAFFGAGGVGVTVGGASRGLRSYKGYREGPEKAPEPVTEREPTTPKTLALPSPDEVILNEREYDPLKNPIGNFSSDELTPEQIRYIDADRKENGKPKLKTYSLEDLVDAVNHSKETPEAKQGIIDNLLTFKTGYKGDVELTPNDIYNIAQQKNVETQTQGFNDFLRRATGSEDVMNMSQPQLFSAFEALSKLDISPELMILPEGTNAVRFSEKQYEKALRGLESVFDEFGTSSLGKTSVIQEIKDFAGLERDADAEALYRQALRRNDLEENLREVKTTEGTKTVPEVSFAGKVEPLPSGFDIRYQTFKQGVEPEAYEIKNGSVVIDRAKTAEEAQKVLEKQTKINEELAKKPQADIAKLEKAIAARNTALDIQRAKGFGDTLGFRKLAAELDARNKVDQKSIEVHRADIQNFSNPLKIVPVGEKPITSKKYVFYEGDKPVASFGDKYQAEQFGIMKLDEDLLGRIIETGPKTKGVLPKRYAAFAAKEMQRRKGELPKGIEIKGSIYTKEVQEAQQKLRQQLLPVLKRFGLEKVGLRIVDSIADGKADGSYVQELIKIAYDAKNPMGTLRHESIHALKELGAFTPEEWKVLTNKAKSDWIDKYIKPNMMEAYRNQYAEENGNLKGFDEFIQEEAIAEAFANFANTKPPAGLIGNIFYRLSKFFEALGNTFKRLGFKTANDIFQKVERGEAKPTKAPVAEVERLKVKEEVKKRPKEEVKKRTMEDLEKAIPPKERVISTDPTKAIDGTKFSNLILSDTGVGFLPYEEMGAEKANEMVNKLWKDSIKESGGDYVQEIVDTLNAKPPSAEFLNAAFSLPDSARYWYETSADAVNDLPIPSQLKDKFIDFISSTSGNAKPLDNMRRAVSVLAEYVQNKPIETDLISQKTVEDAIRNADLQSLKFGNFATTMKYVGGLSKKAPVTTNDSRVAEIFNMNPEEFHKNQVMHEVLSRFYNKLRDAQNEFIPKEMQPYESWQTQALTWVEHRAENTSYGEKTSDNYAQSLEAVTKVLEDKGIPLVNGKIGLTTLKDPKLPNALSGTITQFQDALKATIESNTLLNTQGVEANTEFEKIKNIDESWAKKLTDKFERIQRKLFEDIRSQKVLDDLVSTIVGRKATISRIDTTSSGTFDGALSPNMRVPLFYRTSDGKTQLMTKEQANVLLAVLGDKLDQKAMAASLFKPVSEGGSTFRIFFPNKDLTSAELTAFEKQIGYPLNSYQAPNGGVIEINVGGFDVLPTRESVAEAFSTVFGDTPAKFVACDYDSTYITKDKEGDWAQSYKEVLNGFRRDNFRGSDKSGDRRAFNASLSQSAKEIRNLAKERNKKFEEFTRESREQRAKRGLEKLQIRVPEEAPAKPVVSKEPFEVPETTRRDNLIFLLQDKQIDLKRIIEGIKEQGKEVADKWNAYLQEELFHGRSATRVKFFIDRELQPLLRQMDNAKISLEEMDDYLLARHAKEANEYIRSINKDPKANAGMTDAQADAYIAGIPPARRQVFERIAKEVDKITKETRQLMVDYGLETPETINAWEGKYKYYVPLFREETEGSPISLGRGYSIRGSTTRQRVGSARKVVDVLANIALQRERTIARGEKTRVGNALYGLVLQNPNPDFWMAINPDDMTKDQLRNELISMGLPPEAAENLSEKPKESKFNKATGLYESKTNPLWLQQPNVFVTRVNGQDRIIVFNQNNERAARMAVVFNSLDQNQNSQALAMMGTAGQYFQDTLNAVGKATRYFAAINTQYNPAFSIYNFMRDIGGAVLNLQSTPLKGKEFEIVSNAFTALKSIYQDLRLERTGQEANSKWAEIFEEFELEGGKTGYRDLFNDSESRARALENELNSFKQGGVRKKAKVVFDWLSDFNDAVENAIRVSTYKAAKDSGMSNAQAASLAKNITVNFNRTGAMSRAFTTLYAFFNASVQGSARIAQTMLNKDGSLSPTGKMIVKGGLTIGVLQAIMMATAGFDEDEPPDFVKDKNFIIPYGDKKYIAVPMPLGFNVIPSFGRRITEFVMSNDKNVGKAIFEMGNMILDGFNPLGSATFAQTIAPTIADPIIALAENRDFTGKPIAKDDVSSLNPTPGYTRAKENASAIGVGLAYAVNLLSGGTEFKKGVISPTPDQIDYLIGQITGGVGREALKIEKAVTAGAKGEELATYNIPIVGRMIGDVKQKTVETARFYDNIKSMNEHQQEIEGLLKSGQDISKYLDKYPESVMYKYADKTYNKINKLKKKRKEGKEAGLSDEDLKVYDEAILELMVAFNEIIKDAKGKP